MVYPITAHSMNHQHDEDGGFVIEATTIQDPIGFATTLEDDNGPPWGPPLVEAALHAMRALAESGGVALEASYEGELPMVYADPERVTQLLSNLVGNALKFTPAGGRVEVRVQPYDEGTLVSVTDTGDGIPPEQLPHVFDRFFQVSNARVGARHGAGLGLPIARGIVEAHGGTIWIESAAGRGTTVRFTLPGGEGR